MPVLMSALDDAIQSWLPNALPSASALPNLDSYCTMLAHH